MHIRVVEADQVKDTCKYAESSGNVERKRERLNRLEDKQAIFSSYHLVIIKR